MERKVDKKQELMLKIKFIEEIFEDIFVREIEEHYKPKDEAVPTSYFVYEIIQNLNRELDSISREVEI